MNSKTNAITYAFRKPRFPLICDLDGYLFAAESPVVLQRRLGGLDLSDDQAMRFIDTSGESWMILPKEMILAPEFPPRSGERSKSLADLTGAATRTKAGCAIQSITWQIDGSIGSFARSQRL